MTFGTCCVDFVGIRVFFTVLRLLIEEFGIEMGYFVSKCELGFEGLLFRSLLVCLCCEGLSG